MAIYIIILSNIYCGCKDTCVVISTIVLSIEPSSYPLSNWTKLIEVNSVMARVASMGVLTLQLQARRSFVHLIYHWEIQI